jgi:hypothetical protein
MRNQVPLYVRNGECNVMYPEVITNGDKEEAVFFIKEEELYLNLLYTYRPNACVDCGIRNDFGKAISLLHFIHFAACGELTYTVQFNYYNDDHFHFLRQWMLQEKTRYVLIDQLSRPIRVITEYNSWEEITKDYIRLSLQSGMWTEAEFQELADRVDVILADLKIVK